VILVRLDRIQTSKRDETFSGVSAKTELEEIALCRQRTAHLLQQPFTAARRAREAASERASKTTGGRERRE